LLKANPDTATDIHGETLLGKGFEAMYLDKSFYGTHREE